MSKKYLSSFNFLKRILTCLNPKIKFGFGVVLFVLVLGLFLPLYHTRASLPENIGYAVANFLITVVLQVVVWASGLFLGLATLILGWVTSPSFIGISFTQNDFVTPAWGLVRDLANMGFVIALVAIGLGTALRINQYQAQKTLPWLIIMALAVNFTPVICGIFIDASNIIMEFFLGGGMDFEHVVDEFRTQTSNLWSSIGTANFFEYLGRIIGTIAYNVFAGIAFLLFAFIFAIRYVVLWTLVILSPLAFFAYVLPATRHYWKKWWNLFIQWCFIGVVAAFWLYLGEQMLLVTGDILGPFPPSTEFSGMSVIFSYTIPIIFLFSGLGAALSSAAPIANTIMSSVSQAKGAVTQVAGKAKTVGKVAGGVLGAPLMKGAQMIAGQEKVQEKIKSVSERWAKTPPVGVVAPGAGIGKRLGGWTRRQTTGRFKGVQRAVGRAGLAFSEFEKERIRKAKEQAGKIQTPTLLHSKIASSTGAEQIGLVANAIERGGPFSSADLEKILSPEARMRLGTMANNLGAVPEAEAIARRFHDEAEQMGFELSDEDKEKGYESITDKLIDEARKEKEIKEFSKEFWKSKDAMEAIQKFWGGSQLRTAADTFGREFADKYMEVAEGRENSVDWYLENNPSGLLYLSGNAGQDLGFTSIGGLERTGVREKINEWRKPIADIEIEIKDLEGPEGKIAQKETRIKELRVPVGRIRRKVPQKNEEDAQRIEKEAEELRETAKGLRKLLERKTQMAEEKRIREKEERPPKVAAPEVPPGTEPGPGV